MSRVGMSTNIPHSANQIQSIVTQLKALITERILCFKHGNLNSHVLSPDAIQEIASLVNVRAYINSSPIRDWPSRDREELIQALSSNARRLFVLAIAKDYGAKFLYSTVVIHKYQDPDADTADSLARDRHFLVDDDTQVVADDIKFRERAIEEQTLVSALKIKYMQFHRRILPSALPIEEVGENAAHMALPNVVAHAPEVAWDVKIGKEFLKGEFFEIEEFALTRHRDRPTGEIVNAVAGFYYGDSYYLVWRRGGVRAESSKESSEEE